MTAASQHDIVDDRVALVEALRRVGEGDRIAFEEIYRRTSAKLFGVCLRILPERQAAEEALQDAYLSVWKRAGTYDAENGATAMTWLITVARNRAVDRLRRTAKLATAPIEAAATVADDGPSAIDLAEANEDERRLHHCLGTLGASEAQFVRTTYLEGHTYADLARRLGIPLGTVKSRIHRALGKLRACLQ